MELTESPRRPLRVAFLNDTAGLGGIEMMLLLLARRLPRDFFSPIYVASEPGPMLDGMREAGADVVLVRHAPWWSTSFYVGKRKVLNPLAVLYDLAVIPFYSVALARALRAAGINVVHSSGIIVQIAGGIAARLARIPHVAQVQDIIGQPIIRWLYQRVLELVSDRIAAISHAVARGYAPARTVLIPNAADLERWRKTTHLREELAIGPDEKVIGFAGRLTPWKGQRVFLEAARQLLLESRQNRQADRFRFVLVGDDSVGGVVGYRQELERLAEQEPLQGRVHFLGRRADVLDVMAACDVLVHASTKPEPFGIVIVEGMAVGTPVIATALGGPLDIISDGVDGLLIPPDNPRALVEAIRFLCDYPDKARQMADRARHKSQSVYSAAAMTDRFVAVYGELARRHAIGRTGR